LGDLSGDATAFPVFWPTKNKKIKNKKSRFHPLSARLINAFFMGLRRMQAEQHSLPGPSGRWRCEEGPAMDDRRYGISAADCGALLP